MGLVEPSGEHLEDLRRIPGVVEHVGDLLDLPTRDQDVEAAPLIGSDIQRF
jgi:hypothetical protein